MNDTIAERPFALVRNASSNGDSIRTFHHRFQIHPATSGTETTHAFYPVPNHPQCESRLHFNVLQHFCPGGVRGESDDHPCLTATVEDRAGAALASVRSAIAPGNRSARRPEKPGTRAGAALRQALLQRKGKPALGSDG